MLIINRNTKQEQKAIDKYKLKASLAKGVYDSTTGCYIMLIIILLIKFIYN